MADFDVTNPLASILPASQAPAYSPPDTSSPSNPMTAAPAPQPSTPAMPGVGTGPSQPSAPGKPAPAAGSFGAKLLSAIGGVLTGLTNAAQVAEAPDHNAEMVRQENAKVNQARYQQQQAKEAQDRNDKLTQEQRIQKREDDESHARIADANARTFATTQGSYHVGQDWMDKQVAEGKHDLGSISGEEGAEGLAQVVQSGISGDQMNQLIQAGKLDPYQYTAFKTGTVDSGQKDGNGNPLFDYKYDVVKVPNTWTPTDEQIARIKTVPGYEKYQKGTVMTGAQTLSALAQADTIKTTKATMAKAKSDAGIEAGKETQAASEGELVKSGDWLRFLNTYQGDPVKAASHILQDQEMAKKYGGALYNDVMKQFADDKDITGVKGYSTMLHQQQEDATNRIKAVGAEGGGAIGGGAMTDLMKAHIASLPKDKQAVVAKYDAPTQSSLYSIAFGPGDLDFDKTFPNRVSAKSGQIDAAHALGVIKQLNPNFSPGQYKATQNAYKQATYGRNGQDVETYNNLLDHMSAAQDVVEDSLRQNNPKFLNSAINLAESQGWGTEAEKILTAIEPVKAEFSNLMANGHALHADQQKLYDTMINPAMTPSQLEAAFKNFGATGIVRLIGLNDQYKKIAGNNLPGIVRSEALESAKHLNLDPDTMKKLGSLNSGGVLFNNPNWTAGTPAEQQQDTSDQQQQEQAKADAVKAAGQQAGQLASKAAAAGTLPQGTAGIAPSPTDGNWYYVDQNHKPLARVQ